MRRLGILLSGRGSNFEAIAQSITDGRLDAEIAIVLSNRTGAPGLEIARQRGIPAIALPAQGREREDYDRLLVQKLLEYNVELVCLAGYMRLLGAVFIGAYSGHILNIHPSLLPAFPGLDAQHQAVEYGVKVAGCTVHFVDEQMDSGPIILQAAVPVRDDDTADTLSERILREEHRIYTEAIGLVLAGQLQRDGRRIQRTSWAGGR